MITRVPTKIVGALSSVKYSIAVPTRQFSTTKDRKAKNRIYQPVRNPDAFRTNLLLSTSANIPLLTFWTASYCPSCATVSPLLTQILESGIGEEEGSISYCEVEYDSPDIMSSGLAVDYMISSMPTLLAFSRGEPQVGTKLMDVKQMSDRRFLEEWIKSEARRGGDGGAGGSSIFSGLFGLLRR